MMRTGLLLAFFGMFTTQAAGQCQPAWMADFGGGVEGTGIYALTRFHDQIVAGGLFSLAGGHSASNIAAWDGTAWHPMGQGTDSTIRALSVWNDQLIAGGHFTEAGGVPTARIARWDGRVWHDLGGGLVEPVPDATTGAWSLAEFQGDLYAGGKFSEAGGQPVNSIARWNGSNWSAVPIPTTGIVLALANLQDHLYIAVSKFPPSVYRWDGESLVDMSAGLDVKACGGFSGWGLRALGEFNGTLFVSMYHFYPNKISGNVLRWSGNLWEAIPPLFGPPVWSMASDALGLYVGGEGQATPKVRRWDGKTLTSIGDAMTPTSAPVKVLLHDGGHIIAAWAGGPGSSNIARWGCLCPADCDNSSSLDIDDFICFQTLFAVGNYAADCDTDGTLSIDDFACFQSQYALGC